MFRSISTVLSKLLSMSRLDVRRPVGGVKLYCVLYVRRFIEMWMMCWSLVCLVLAAFTCATFLVDTDRFRSALYITYCRGRVGGAPSTGASRYQTT